MGPPHEGSYHGATSRSLNYSLPTLNLFPPKDFFFYQYVVVIFYRAIVDTEIIYLYVCLFVCLRERIHLAT